MTGPVNLAHTSEICAIIISHLNSGVCRTMRLFPMRAFEPDNLQLLFWLWENDDYQCIKYLHVKETALQREKRRPPAGVESPADYRRKHAMKLTKDALIVGQPFDQPCCVPQCQQSRCLGKRTVESR
ncbi:hypothetical protein Y032_0031g2315 [Ancylostoma ceylanicum]|uniref:Uncharacterized protein n=1 Tax=Ancylostoma ceylanicum TaxID=53326 RepID=A0A016URP2_9BILA|nr:hypothetical protein Y032_0031g2315 [Ancylostoma ceylanicum]